MGNLEKNLATAKPIKNRCKFRGWYLTLDDEDKKIVIDVLQDREGWTVSEMLNFFTQHGGCPVREKTLRAHRNGICFECGNSWD